MKRIYTVIFILVLVAGCSNPEQSTEMEAAEEYMEMLFEEGVEEEIGLEEVDNVIYFHRDPELEPVMNKFWSEYEMSPIREDMSGVLTENNASKIAQKFCDLMLRTDVNELSFIGENERLRINYWGNVLLNQSPNKIHPDAYDGYLETDESEMPFVTALMSFSRSPQNIEVLWSWSKQFFFNRISAQEYEKKHIKDYVDDLILTRDFIKENNNEVELYADLYYSIITGQQEYGYCGTECTMDMFCEYAPESVLRKYSFYPYEAEYITSDAYSRQASWFVSFWMRRNQESNLEVVYSILKEIQSHYASDNSMAYVPNSKVAQLPNDTCKVTLTCMCGSTRESSFEYSGILFEPSPVGDAFNQVIIDNITMPFERSEENRIDVTGMSKSQLRSIVEGEAESMKNSMIMLNAEQDMDEAWAYEYSSSLSSKVGDLMCLDMSGYTYTGGAHGNYYSSYYVYSLSQEKLINLSDYIINEEELIDHIRYEIRKNMNIPSSESLEDFGYWSIGIPANIGVSSGMVYFYYNPYEIAPYALGSTLIEMKKEEAQRFFSIPL